MGDLDAGLIVMSGVVVRYAYALASHAPLKTATLPISAVFKGTADAKA